MKSLAISLLMLASSTGALAQSSYYKHDLKNCRLDSGQPMDKVECDALRKYFAAEDAKKAKHDAALAAATIAFEQDKAAEKAVRDERAAAANVRRDIAAAETEDRDDRYRKQRAADEATEAAADKRAMNADAARQAKCGADYKKPRIGMTMDRVRECVSLSFKVSGQINTAQGVVTTYKAPGGFLHVIDDKVVQWGYFRQ